MRKICWIDLRFAITELRAPVDSRGRGGFDRCIVRLEQLFFDIGQVDAELLAHRIGGMSVVTHDDFDHHARRVIKFDGGLAVHGGSLGGENPGTAPV